MNLKIAYIFLALSAAISFILICLLLGKEWRPATCGTRPQHIQETGHRVHNDHNLVFADLTPGEMVRVVKYLRENLGVPLVDASRANPSDNCIYYISMQLPTKAEVLRFLDRGGVRPPRQALAVIFFGNQPMPNVTEYLVGPLPKPTYHRDITVLKYGRKLPYYGRLILQNEYDQIDAFLRSREFPKAPNFMSQVFDYNGTNLASLNVAPRGFQSGDRKTWILHFQAVTGFYVHPMGLEVLVDHSSLNISQWKVLKVFYNGQYFEGMVQLESEFKQGHVKVDKVKKTPTDGGYSSLKPRVPHQNPGPLQYEPRGPRYSIRSNQVVFQAWSFAFGMDVHTGPRLFDIRFKGERIAYELGLQEASAIYSSNSPGAMSARYLDASYGIGKFAFSLVPGVDCPYLATYLDSYYLIDSFMPEKRENSICIFEENSEIPVRRHYSKMNYGGLASSVLVFRTISTLENYDYIWNFIFHQSGAVEVKVQATGYISSSFFFGDGTEFGSRVQEHTLGTMHNHALHFKVDLDIGGTKNSLVTHDMAFETVQVPWSPEHHIERPRLIKKVLDKEDKAAFRLDSKMPRYIYFAANSENKWGQEQGYRFQIISFPGDHLPETSTMERAISWGRYKLAVTKRKEDEPTSSSIYNQNDPWTPTVAFADFINNETIINEDLVAWITIGFLHIPHAEDVPNTVTVGNTVGFFLRPYNYYDEDPSIYSPDGVFFTSEQDFGSCEVNPIACLSKTASCLPNFPPFTYSGFQNMTRL
ncbi:LOW QUALITY PROTEIN: membrane primary amine oxidase-like [Alligator sinensis]|uniref:Amine oxidase n=1 Tax=Alligator sinensis TaxID=38654 RepID=A0A3Q0GAL1_ALLSI|nr:LOW QUALITY PROTEIN: membrane primary amine oxidase-like [Alligator sinensis]